LLSGIEKAYNMELSKLLLLGFLPPNAGLRGRRRKVSIKMVREVVGQGRVGYTSKVKKEVLVMEAVRQINDNSEIEGDEVFTFDKDLLKWMQKADL